MAAHRIPMRRIKYILSLRYEQNYSERRIAQQVGVGRSTVSRTLARVQQTGLTWSQCAALSDAELQRQLFPSDDKQQVPQRPLPDWEQVHKALAKHSYMTVRQLWLEYKAGHPDGLEYSQFCLRYRQWRGSDRHLEMRLEHRAGEKLFVDYSGKRPSIVDPRTGQSREVELFVATLGASHYTFVEATLTQQLKDVCGSLRRCFEFLGGTPRVLVPDNMKTAVTATNRGDVAKINATFQELADHYQVCVLPTRPGKPKDKLVDGRAADALAILVHAVDDTLEVAVQREEEVHKQAAAVLKQRELRPLRVRRCSGQLQRAYPGVLPQVCAKLGVALEFPARREGTAASLGHAVLHGQELARAKG